MKTMPMPKKRTNLVKRPRAAAMADDDFQRLLIATLTAVEDGDFSARMPADLLGAEGKVAESVNSIASRLEYHVKRLSPTQKRALADGTLPLPLPQPALPNGDVDE